MCEFYAQCVILGRSAMVTTDRNLIGVGLLLSLRPCNEIVQARPSLFLVSSGFFIVFVICIEAAFDFLGKQNRNRGWASDIREL